MTRSHSSRLLAAGIAALIAFSVSAAEPKRPVNVCIEGAADCGTTPDRTSSDGIKWHPGHYVFLDSIVYASNIEKERRIHFSQISKLDADPTIKGIKIHVYWAALEGPKAGDYSRGFEVLDAYLQKLSSLKTPRRLMLLIQERAYGTYNETRMDVIKTILPEYIVTSPEYGCVYGDGPGHLGLAAKIWEKPTMDRLIALSEALAKRYDKHPLFEMVSFSETTLSFPNSGFTLSAYHAQLERWFEASSKVWKHTQLRLNANFGGSDANMRTLIERTTRWGDVAVGGPDPEIATRTIQANGVFRGERGGGKDLRGVLAWVGEQQGLGLGSTRYAQLTRTPEELFDYQYNTMRANYMIWQHNEYLGGDAQKWATGILPFVRSVNGKIHTECPQAYKNRCESD